MKNQLTILFLLISSLAFSQGTLISVSGWNAYVALPASYAANPTKVYPTIVFFPGLGEVGTIASKVIAQGPSAYVKQLGNTTLGGTEFIVISLQPPAAYPVETVIQAKLSILKSSYRIDPKRLYLTGLSHGGWCSTTFVTGDPLGGPYTYASQVAAVVDVEGVMPDDNAPYPALFDNFAKSGGKLLSFEQKLDNRGAPTRVNRMNATVPGSAIYIQTNFGTGGHCCWNDFYGGNGVQPGKFMINGKSQNMYEWLTSLAPVFIPAPVVTTPASFTVEVGTAFSYQVVATNNPTSYTAVQLPTGLTISSTGLISGTPTTVQTTAPQISATNAGGTGTALFGFTINAKPKVISMVQTIIDNENTGCSIKITYYTDGTFIKEKL